MAASRRRQHGSVGGNVGGSVAAAVVALVALRLQQLGGGVASSLDGSHNDNNDKNKHNNQTVHGRGRRMTVVAMDNKQQ